ncbi:MAG: DNA cytosine methyltransferase [Firmicutes bacterium]|nr:DNA cytosine methyltransferase [Bacillota bacterium]
MPVRIGSCFSGLGGIDLAFQLAGAEIAWQIEIDPAARDVLARHWPEVPRYEDITRVDPSELDPVDVIVGGSPCQDLSTAGRREGLAGEQSRLFFDFVRLADHFPRAVVVWENVPGALSSNDGEDFAAVLREITGHWPGVPAGGWRGAGFCWGPKRLAVWRVLDAQHFGVPQRRRRIFLVAGPRTGPDPLAVLFEPGGVPGDPPPRREAGAGPAAPLTAGAGGRGGHAPGRHGEDEVNLVPWDRPRAAR